MPSGQLDPPAMEALDAMNQHRSVDLRQDVGSDLDDVIRGDAQNVRVERAMMERAQRNTVRHDRLSLRMAIGQDVCRLQQLLVLQLADRAMALVGLDYPQTERLLMQPLLDLARDVATSARRVLVIIPRLIRVPVAGDGVAAGSCRLPQGADGDGIQPVAKSRARLSVVEHNAGGEPLARSVLQLAQAAEIGRGHRG